MIAEFLYYHRSQNYLVIFLSFFQTTETNQNPTANCSNQPKQPITRTTYQPIATINKCVAYQPCAHDRGVVIAIASGRGLKLSIFVESECSHEEETTHNNNKDLIIVHRVLHLLVVVLFEKLIAVSV